jgi:D-alanyl-lipoteichoic acid acyltransferase DltB (MBOAT superfamily)
VIVAKIPKRRRRLFLFGYIPILLIPLAYYKYRTFFLEQALGWETVTLDVIIIPAGISFYTFQMIAILVDGSRLADYRPKALDFLNFTSFFPQVVAGPIERKDDLMPQMERFHLHISMGNLNLGAPWLALGFFYKICLADNLSPFIDRDAMASAWPVLWNTLLFGFKIYFDFCGYSLIALGLGKALGIDLTLNFRSPYLATNIRDFWRRWHVSLSYWFRDYVYIPLGGSKTKLWPLNLLIVFIVSGLWHGAGWGFLLWGALHGIYCVVGHATKNHIRLPPVVGWATTMFLAFAAWLPFYETRWDILKDKLALLCQPAAYSPHLLMSYIHSFNPASLFTMAVAAAMCGGAIALEGFSARRGDYYGFAKHPVAVAFLVAATVWLGSSQGNAFVYFSF